MLLGCAYASRFASLACGMEDANIAYGGERMYQKRLKIWQQMQDNSAMPLFGTPKPAPIHAPITPDDQKPYDLSGRKVKANATPREEEKARSTPAEEEKLLLAELAQNALRSFAQARQLSLALPPKSRTQIAYDCGWGMLLLYRYGKDIIPFVSASLSAKQDKTAKSADPNEPLRLEQDEMIACFQECADYDKKKADYWQALAFAYAPDYLLNVYRSDDVEKIAQSNTNQVEKAIPHLRHALKLKRDDAQILYQIAIVAALTRPQDSIDSLQKLTAVENQNAVSFYLLADAQLNRASELKGEEATRQVSEGVATMQAGNRASDYRNIAIVLPVSRWLAGAWAYRPLYGIGHDSRWGDSLFSLLDDAAKSAIENKQSERLMTLGAAQMEMGLNRLKHYKGDDLDSNALPNQLPLYYRAFYGLLLCAKAHRHIRAAADMMPTEAHLALVDHYAQVENYWKAWDTALFR